MGSIATQSSQPVGVLNIERPCNWFLRCWVPLLAWGGCCQEPGNLGKSLLAGKVLERVGRSLGIEEFLEITVEGSDFLDLTGYDHRMHCGVVAVMPSLCFEAGV